MDNRIGEGDENNRDNILPYSLPLGCGRKFGWREMCEIDVLQKVSCLPQHTLGDSNQQPARYEQPLQHTTGCPQLSKKIRDPRKQCLSIQDWQRSSRILYTRNAVVD